MQKASWRDYINKMTWGDSVELLQTLPDKCVDLVLTDPPYELSTSEQAEFHYQFRRLCKGSIIVFCKPENQWIKPIPPDQYLFWIKPISTKNTSRSYSRFVEMILVFDRGPWNADRHWSQYTNVFTDLVDVKVHVHRKPPSLMERLILNHSNPGDLILDSFGGSGVVGLVAKDSGRDYIMFDKG